MKESLLQELFAPMGREDSFYLYHPEERVLYIALDHPIESLEEFRRGEYSTAAFPFWVEKELKEEWRGFSVGVRRWHSFYAMPFSLETRIEKVSVGPQIEAEPYEIWAKLFDVLQDAIAKETVEKVVASRRVAIETERDIHLPQVFSNLLRDHPTSYVFVYREKGKAFIGATPEILVEKKEKSLRTFALAGTMARREDAAYSEGELLLDDEKNRREHQFVIDAIVEQLEPHCEEVVVEETGVLSLRHVFHLKTDIAAVEKERSSILEWMERLHPTPAMGGTPKESAMALLEEKEPYERGFFASPIGLVKDNGDGLLLVGIRSALVVDERHLYAYAGCGIVDSSDCRSEYEEIGRKLQTVVEAL